jgi:hypothetical protein
MFKYLLFIHMYSPQPLSASQRGAKKLLTPFFCQQENPACGIDEVNGAGGMSTCKVEENSKFLLFIPDCHLIFVSLSPEEII